MTQSEKVSQLLKNSSHQADLPKRKNRPRTRRVESFKYKATQVINREIAKEQNKTIPIGTNLIGRLLTSIDTREVEQLYKVILPYGGKFKRTGEFPKGSIIFGKVRYRGKGDRLFIKFEKGIYPDGREFELHAQALSTNDYSPGLQGDFHGKAGGRIAATLGLTMVSGMTNVLTEKQELGKEGAVAPKATMRNAMYAGVSKVTEMEAGRQAQKLAEEQEYVTIGAGKDLIVNLTAGFMPR